MQDEATVPELVDRYQACLTMLDQASSSEVCCNGGWVVGGRCEWVGGVCVYTKQGRLQHHFVCYTYTSCALHPKQQQQPLSFEHILYTHTFFIQCPTLLLYTTPSLLSNTTQELRDVDLQLQLVKDVDPRFSIARLSVTDPTTTTTTTLERTNGTATTVRRPTATSSYMHAKRQRGLDQVLEASVLPGVLFAQNVVCVERVHVPPTPAEVPSVYLPRHADVQVGGWVGGLCFGEGGCVWGYVLSHNHKYCAHMYCDMCILKHTCTLSHTHLNSLPHTSIHSHTKKKPQASDADIERSLQALRHIAACELAACAAVRKELRRLMLDKATISTSMGC